MSAAVVASAPLAAPLASGLWVALDRRVSLRLSRAAEGVSAAARESLWKGAAAQLDGLQAPASLAWALRVLAELGLHQGWQLDSHARVSPAAGLAGDCALALAAAGAGLRLLGEPAHAATASAVVARCARPADGDAGARLAALANGGAWSAVPPPAEARGSAESAGAWRVAVDPARLDERLVLIECPAAARSCASALTEAEREAAASLAAQLENGAWDCLAAQLEHAWEVALAAHPQRVTPEAQALLASLKARGAAGRPCGAGGGGFVLGWVPGQSTVFLRALPAGARGQAVRVDLLGLDVDSV